MDNPDGQLACWVTSRVKVRRIMGDKLRRSLPAVALLGASAVLLCDIIGRSIRYPFEVPVATVFGVVGTVIFLWLLLRAPAES